MSCPKGRGVMPYACLTPTHAAAVALQVQAVVVTNLRCCSTGQRKLLSKPTEGFNQRHIDTDAWMTSAAILITNDKGKATLGQQPRCWKCLCDWVMDHGSLDPGSWILVGPHRFRFEQNSCSAISHCAAFFYPVFCNSKWDTPRRLWSHLCITDLILAGASRR